MKKYWYYLVLFVVIVWSALVLSKPVQAERQTPEGMVLVEATAYYDAYGTGRGADGRELVEGLTIAGCPEWLGMTAVLYDMDYRLIGIYEFRDTGYGQSTGYGRSQILPGRSIGTIEAGQCVDIYMTTKAKCRAWGRRKVFMQLIRAEG